MAIYRSDGPSAQETIATEVAELRNRGRSGVLGGAAPLSATAPLPLYAVNLKDLIAKGIVESAQLKGWRYLLTNTPVDREVHPTIPADENATEMRQSSGQVTAVADAAIKSSSTSTTTRFSSLTHGVAAERLVEASNVADSNFSDSSEAFEPRILEIPALNTTALWLHSEQSDHFIPYIGEGASSAAPPVINEHFGEVTRQLAEGKLRDLESRNFRQNKVTN